MKVLIVDDDINVVAGLEEIIPWNKMEIQLIPSAKNGKEALEKIYHYRPDLVLTDIRMPKMDGLELIKEIRKNFVDINIIILSAYEEFSYAQEAIKLGVQSYVLKPINKSRIEKLMTNINQIKIDHIHNNKKYINYTFRNKKVGKLVTHLNNHNSENIKSNIFEKIDFLKSDSEEFKHYVISTVFSIFDYYMNHNILILDEKKESIINSFVQEKNKTIITDNLKGFIDDFCDELKNKKNQHSELTMENVKKYIKKKYSDVDFSFSEVADYFNMSQPYLSEQFHKLTGKKLSEYLTEIRIKKACELLCDPTIKMVDICTKVGYRDSNYFSKVFKKIMHTTPTAYKQMKAK